jgi:putative ABC transport system ATP-binding protein
MGLEILSVQHLTKTYGTGETRVEALKDVSFSVKKGEFVSVIGPSGSGKSTLLNMIGALDRPTSGIIRLDGRDIGAMKEAELSVFRRRKIGFVFQAYNLVPELNVEENVVLPLLLDGREPDEAYLRELLDVLGLSERKHHLPSQLSGGQQQRAAIGRALAAKPAIILADEPTGNLDSRNSRDVINLLKLSVERYQQTLIMITHNRISPPTRTGCSPWRTDWSASSGGGGMKSYLGLASKYLSAHKKRTRLSVLSIVLSVALVAACFPWWTCF